MGQSVCYTVYISFIYSVVSQKLIWSLGQLIISIFSYLLYQENGGGILYFNHQSTYTPPKQITRMPLSSSLQVT